MNKFIKIKYCLCFILICIFLSSPALGADVAKQESSEFWLFLGRFHPLFVHLPIGFLIIAFLLECFSRLQRFKEVRHATSLILLLGTISAVAAAILGYFLSLEGGYDEHALFWHQWFGIGVAVTAVLSYFLKLRSTGKVTMVSKVYFTTLALSMVTLMAAGHLGGNLTHGSEYLTQYMPVPLRTMAGLPAKSKVTIAKPITNIQEAVVYTDIIHPIFEKKCISCHNPDKKKGDLLMHTYQEMMQGGENGKVIAAGTSVESPLFKHIMLPLEHDDHMPPKGKKQLTKAEVELIRWWIDEGAPADKKVAQVKVSEPVQQALAQLGVPIEEVGAPKGIFAKQVPPADIHAIRVAKESGFMVMPISQDNHYLQVKYIKTAEAFSGEQAKVLQPLSGQITWLDISDAQIANEGLQELSKLTNLTRLRIDQTNVNDQSVEYLQDFDKLEYLNLYGTAITDKGLEQLASLKNLQSLYLWRTKITPKGLQALQEKLLKLTVNVGWHQTPDSLHLQSGDSIIRVINDRKLPLSDDD